MQRQVASFGVETSRHVQATVDIVRFAVAHRQSLIRVHHNGVKFGIAQNHVLRKDAVERTHRKGIRIAVERSRKRSTIVVRLRVRIARAESDGSHRVWTPLHTQTGIDA